MPDLETQLRTYADRLDDLYPDVGFDELFDEVAAPSRRRPRRGVLIALATAILVLVVVGSFLLLLADDPPIVDEPVPPPTTAPGEPGGFEGIWTSVRLGALPNLLTFTETGDGRFTFRIEDSGGATELAHLCSGWMDEVPAKVTGGVERIDANRLTLTEQAVACGDGSSPVGDVSYLFDTAATGFSYHPSSDTVVDGTGREWRRVVALEPSMTPAVGEWRGIWPQSTRADGEEAQRLADGGDPEYAWQVIDMGPETDEYEDVAMAFVREVIGWESYQNFDGGQMTEDASASVMGPGYGRFVRCDPGGSNSHYPELGCAPATGNTFEMVTVHYDNLVRRETGGIAIVTGWVETTLEQAVPPAPDEIRRLVEEFLAARLAGEGAEVYIAGPAPEGADLYASNRGSRFVDYELVANFYPEGDLPAEFEPQWPRGSYDISARLTAADGSSIYDFYEVRPEDYVAGVLRWYSSGPGE